MVVPAQMKPTTFALGGEMAAKGYPPSSVAPRKAPTGVAPRI